MFISWYNIYRNFRQCKYVNNDIYVLFLLLRSEILQCPRISSTVPNTPYFVDENLQCATQSRCVVLASLGKTKCC